MSELIQPVKNGVIDQTSSTKETTAKNTLGKDAFLQLLVAQMKYQDPLNPATNTEYIAQLATFSQLEQMQNLNAMASNSQALSLVGKYVIVKTKSDLGNINYISGRVDYVNMSNNKARISVNGKLYSIEDIDSVIDDTYILEQGRPRIDKKAELEYDAKNPSDIVFEVYQGEGEAKADEVAVIVENTLLDSSVVTLKDNKVIIDKSVFQKAPNGVYKVTVIFNDPLTTVVKDMVTITVKNSDVVPGDDDVDDEDQTGDENTVTDEVVPGDVTEEKPAEPENESQL
ncbi:flagellar basal-body rod modification protein FlgD [Herbinix hemicellulosilytica]|uniref:Basal-body rod modification protein FlgD n=1 Tax=Herbinix hemicellulosilytica TaxID=1564487 RepID=A0A0H5SIF1_HERHM|nr:flagellar hook capping FlgD N-terminal domain-containing protein [Herbinix hemicellulosilytica]RBP60866.1 flagellar basal-body rod modification protein FlgD [Herbinix hemicellulosilytica]CRZ34561.1 hypothetical protein HHT355_1360 [Herbinix hemicellulosilytica]